MQDDSSNPYENLQGAMTGTLRGNAENMFGLNTGEHESKYASFDDLDSDSDDRDNCEEEAPDSNLLRDKEEAPHLESDSLEKEEPKNEQTP